MRIAVLGLGEAGSMYAKAFVEASWEVVGFDPRSVEIPGMTSATSIAEAVAGADAVLGLTTAAHAAGAARDAAPHLEPTTVFLDLNAGSPQLKQAVADEIGERARVVDGAVIGSVKKFGAQVRVILSGPDAESAADVLRSIGATADVVSDTIGDASGRKLLRSVYMKGLGALISEAMSAGRAAGEEAWMRAQIVETLVDGDAAVTRLDEGTRIHADRRSHELGDSLELLSALPGSWPVTEGARRRHVDLAFEAKPDFAAELESVPTAALGDGGDRLGFAHSSIKPIWPSGPIAGRARTVLVNPGDNRALHEALKVVQPGEVLVIAGGGYAERALLGELIAERAVNAGVRGIIVDGAVRDVSAIAEIGLPVWAVAVSPAGPYKSGPGRVGETISLGGAICSTGDYVVADEDGVLVLPLDRAAAALRAGRAVLADEAGRRVEILRQRAEANPSA
ncbi:NAD(P)-binding domain-containing protein [Pseudoclavibacter sp. 8L]|uniref:RraA family protein n=1 Tax=Pseudoclavibacter sp. 8L TaxID=2653162 RepID=UPI001358249D|nr:NAD(P)-binding domain-containing protein [Pseudoclavibacter sp. 8L]